jgi:hypothetical protein
LLAATGLLFRTINRRHAESSLPGNPAELGMRLVIPGPAAHENGGR